MNLNWWQLSSYFVRYLGVSTGSSAKGKTPIKSPDFDKMIQNFNRSHWKWNYCFLSLMHWTKEFCHQSYLCILSITQCTISICKWSQFLSFIPSTAQQLTCRPKQFLFFYCCCNNFLNRESNAQYKRYLSPKGNWTLVYCVEGECTIH